MIDLIFYCSKEHRNEVRVKNYSEMKTAVCSECGRRMERFEEADKKGKRP